MTAKQKMSRRNFIRSSVVMGGAWMVAGSIPVETTFALLSFYLILLIDSELYLTFECFVYRFCKEKINKRRFFLTAILTASLFCR